ncbi:MAG: phage holin family protein [Methanobacterium sp.]|nr:phage holin family protein [Methanobacterium sp.]
MSDNTLLKAEKKPWSFWIGRTLILWIGGVLGFMLVEHFSMGLYVKDWETAFVAVALLGILNALFWPLLVRIFLPFMIITVGVGTLILNGFLIWIISEFLPGITIGGPALILTPLVMTLINTTLSTLLTIDQDAAFYRIVLRNKIKEYKGKEDNRRPGIIFLEIDGLAKNIVKEALEEGYMPTLKSWMDKGTHKITGWETDLSSQTGASQAGILHGNNHNLPAFRWVEKSNNNKIMVSTGLNDAKIIEERISNGKGLLYSRGASRSNLFSGDAEDVIFTYSRLKDLKKFYNKTWFYFYSSPANFGRIIALFLWEVLLEFKSQITHSIRNIKPRMKRGLVYPFVRAGAAVFLREITTYTLIGDIINGNFDVIYVTYLGYDEVAHHSGTRDPDAFHTLRGIDKQFKRLEQAKTYAKRNYHLVVQSDHGQTNGATFKQRYGRTLEDLVRGLMPPETNIYSELSSNEDHFGQAITNPGTDAKRYLKDKRDDIVENSLELRDNTLKVIEESSLVRGSLADHIKNYQVKEHPKKISKEEAEVIVLASGNLGLIYLTQWKERLSYEQINQLYPDLIPGIAQHEGIGFIMVNSINYGPLAINGEGIYYLRDGKVEGENPLANFGPHIVQHLLRTDKFKFSPDILVNSFYDPEKNEVAAFEELIGSHGGIGGEQSYPFIMHPVEWNLEQNIIGAEELHRIIKGFIV